MTKKENCTLMHLSLLSKQNENCCRTKFIPLLVVVRPPCCPVRIAWMWSDKVRQKHFEQSCCESGQRIATFTYKLQTEKMTINFTSVSMLRHSSVSKEKYARVPPLVFSGRHLESRAMHQARKLVLAPSFCAPLN